MKTLHQALAALGISAGVVTATSHGIPAETVGKLGGSAIVAAHTIRRGRNWNDMTYDEAMRDYQRALDQNDTELAAWYEQQFADVADAPDETPDEDPAE